jgi:hypothetical protein
LLLMMLVMAARLRLVMILFALPWLWLCLVLRKANCAAVKLQTDNLATSSVKAFLR